MAVHALSLTRGTIHAPSAPDLPFEMALADWVRRTPIGAPITILVHGYKFSPNQPKRDPHGLIFAPQTRHHRPKFTSWPEGLGFTDEPRSGLCIGFGWPAADSDHPGPRLSAFERVYAGAAAAGRALARVIAAIADLAPDRPVDLFAHSLGARVALQALARAPEQSVGQVVLMAAAEYDQQAANCLATGAGQSAQVYNVTARENAIFDLLMQRVAPPTSAQARPLGAGISHWRSNCVDLPIDQPTLAPIFTRRGIALGPRLAPVCHWSVYTRPGAMELYAEIRRCDLGAGEGRGLWVCRVKHREAVADRQRGARSHADRRGGQACRAHARRRSVARTSHGISHAGR